MGHCRDCRFWDRAWALAAIRERHPCELAGLSYGVVEHGNSAAFIQATGEHAWLYTTPEFGCVQFQETEQGEPA